LVEQLTDGFPVAAHMRASGLQKKLLQCFVELSDGFLFINPDVALQAFKVRVCTSRDGVCQLRLSRSRRSFDQQGPMHLRCKEYGWEDGFIDHVLRCEQAIRKIFWRREHRSRSQKLERYDAP